MDIHGDSWLSMVIHDTVGWSGNRMVRRSDGLTVRRSGGRAVGQSDNRTVGQPDGRTVGPSASQTVAIWNCRNNRPEHPTSILSEPFETTSQSILDDVFLDNRSSLSVRHNHFLYKNI